MVNKSAVYVRTVYSSVNELADVAERHLRSGTYTGAAMSNGAFTSWSSVKDWDEWRKLVRDGWVDKVSEFEEMALKAIESVTAELESETFHPVWDVTGCEVDVARFLSGEPENMIEYVPVMTTRHGRVVTISASISVSGSTSHKTIVKRGSVIVALAIALQRLGYSTELWADHTGQVRTGETHNSRILVKSATHDLDTARIAFVFAHPAMLRTLSLPALHELPKTYSRRLRPGNYGVNIPQPRDLPDGTVYSDGLPYGYDRITADDELRGYLRDLGIIQ